MPVRRSTPAWLAEVPMRTAMESRVLVLALSVLMVSTGCSSASPEKSANDGAASNNPSSDGGTVDAPPIDDGARKPDVSQPGSDAGVPKSDATPPKDTGGPSTLTPGESTVDMTVAGQARTAILYVPAAASSKSQFAIALHGDGDTDTNFLATSGLKPLADADGTVLVLPQGITRDVVVQLGGGMTQTVPGVDWDAYNSAANGNIDLPFLDQLRTQVVGTGQVDPDHVFVFGYSQGGYLAFEYGMVTSPLLACAAVLAASSPYGGGSGDPLILGAVRKIPVVLQIGTEDGAFSAAQDTESTLESDGFPTSCRSCFC
jgi:predicted esterase